MRKGIILLTTLALTLIISCTIQTQIVNAQSASSIYIRADGSVDPAAAPIQQVGTTYQITANINNTSLVILKNNIVVDGQGFTIQGTGSLNNQAAINLTCTNVTVNNFRISGWQVGVLGVFDNNRIVSNDFKNNLYAVEVYANNYQISQNFIGYERIVGNNNVISQNEISLGDDVSGFWISSSSGTVIEANDVILSKETTSFISTDNENYQVCHNNFLNIQYNTGGALVFVIGSGIPYWDNGASGNYWSDYVGKYNNASEIDNSGIWDTPYVPTLIPTRTLDRYPLVAPYNFTKPVMVDAPTPTPTPNPTTSPSVPEFPAWSPPMLIMLIWLVLVFVNKKRLLENPRVP